MNILRLAWRQLLREFRAGELKVMFIALVIAVASSTAIGYFNTRLGAAMQLRASEFLGADLVLEGSLQASAEQRALAADTGLRHSNVIEFASVVSSEQGIQLSSIKAIDAAYPLRGQLQSSAELQGEENTGGGPAPGELWAQSRLLNALGLHVGDQVEIGRASLRLTRILTHEPSSAGDFYSLNPHVLINLQDLEATGVIQPGSRVRYKELWSGPEAALKTLHERLEPTLAPQQSLKDSRSASPQLGNALERAERYLSLASLAAVMLAGVAVALSAARFARRRFDTGALLRCLGLSRRHTLSLFCLQLLMLGLLASLAGALLGWLAQFGLFKLLQEVLPRDIPAPGLLPALVGMATGLIALAGFALPPLAALGRVPPLRVLRRDLEPIPVRTWLVYAMTLGGLGLIMWQLSQDLKLTLALLGGGGLASLLLGALWLVSLKSLRRLSKGARLHWRLGLGQLLRHPVTTAGQTLAFGLILLAMALVVLLRGELLDNWQQQLPADAPNHFALNILPDERQAFAQDLETMGARLQPLYPVVQGRLVGINDEPIADFAIPDSSGDRAIRRDLSLTWSSELPRDNQLVAGRWWREARSEVSVELDLARSLGIHLNDRLEFDIAGQRIQATVTSLRQVNWDNFQPNFYMVFSAEALQEQPHTYLTSFYLPAGNERQLIEFSRNHPSITLLQIDAILAQLRDILSQVTLAVEYVLLFVLAAGLCVLLAGLQSTLDERIRQGALLRALGAERRLLNRIRLSEFCLLGASSGALAAVGCELVSLALYEQILDLPWSPHPWLLLLLPLGALLVAITGLSGTRQVVNSSPLQVLRDH